MAISIVLLLIDIVGFEFSTIDLLGNSVKIQNPRMVPVCIWSFWLYFLIRYIQVRHELTRFKTARHARVQQLTENYIKTAAQRIFYRKYDPVNASGRNQHRSEFLINAIQTLNDDEHSYRVKVVFSKRSDGVTNTKTPIEMAIGYPHVRNERIKANLFVMFRTIEFTEYIFPYFVAASPVVRFIGRVVSD